MASPPHHQHLVRFGAGDPIYREGETGATLYLVASGRVRLFRAAAESELDLGILERGDCFGEASVLEGVLRTASAAAVEPCELIEIDGAALDKMIRGNPEIAVRLLRKMSQRLREAERRAGESSHGGRANEPPTGWAAGVPAFAGPRPGARAPRPSAASRTGARLELDDGVVLPLPQADCAIGRFDPVTELRPEIDLGAVDLKRSVARSHARISRTEEGWTLVADAGAANGTWVNDRQIDGGQSQPLGDGDQLRFGAVHAVFRT